MPPFSRTLAGRTLADNFRSQLKQAANAGEAFDTGTGLPDSLVEQTVLAVESWLEFAMAYVSMKWPGAAGKSRTSIVDALATVTPALVEDVPGRPEQELLREALRDYLLPPDRRDWTQPEDVALAVKWLEAASLPLTGLTEAAVVRAGLDALGLKMDGKPAAKTTTRRKRAVFFNVLEYAVELEKLEYNPIGKLRVRSRRKTKAIVAVDRRVVVNPRQGRQLLAAVTYIGDRGRGARMRAFFACLYFAALCPGEALGLRDRDAQLPARCAACGADLTHDFDHKSRNGCDHAGDHLCVGFADLGEEQACHGETLDRQRRGSRRPSAQAS